jgi:hypothetical protein
MVTGSHLDEGRAGRGRNSLDLAEKAPTDASVPSALVHDEGEDTDGDVIVLEARHDMEGHETDEDALGVGHDDLRGIIGEAAEARLDDRRRDRVALFGEQLGDPGRVGGSGGSEGSPREVDHRGGWYPGHEVPGRWRDGQRVRRSAIGPPTTSKPSRE